MLTPFWSSLRHGFIAPEAARILKYAAVALTLFSPAITHAEPAKPKWESVAPDELSSTAPLIESNAKAEAILRRLEIDDRDYPEKRAVRFYSRYKIFDPERAEDLLTSKVIAIGYELNNDYALSARLHLPSGEVKEFGKEAFLERETEAKIPQDGWRRLFGVRSLKIKEKYLAISGVERGAVLEYCCEWKYQKPNDQIYPLQLPEIPIRKLEVIYTRKKNQSDTDTQVFFLNQRLADERKIKAERTPGEIRFFAENLPSIYSEPMLGPDSDNALAFVIGSDAMAKYSVSWRARIQSNTTYYDPPVPDGGPGPWVAWAGTYFIWDHDKGKVSSQVKKQAHLLTATLKTEIEKAESIHNFVQKLRYEYAIMACMKQLRELPDDVALPDVALNYAKTKRAIWDETFLALALALYRAAGLEARSILLPDRSLARFDKWKTVPLFLSRHGIGVHIDGHWYFSYPHTDWPVPFNMLPSENEGQLALVARATQQEFIAVHATESERSQMINKGRFKLIEKGTISGECSTAFTGHLSMRLRAGLRTETQEQRKKHLEDFLRDSFPPCTLDVQGIEGLGSSAEPLLIKYTVQIESHAALSKDMMIIKPSLFRSGLNVLRFPAPERHAPVVFPCRWEEYDDVEIELPEGYTLGDAFSPPSYPGTSLHYAVKMQYRRTARRFHITREFKSNLLEVPVTTYPELKQWYDGVAASDAHEIAFKRQIRAANAEELPAK